MIALAATAALAAAVLAGCGAPAEPGLPEVKWTQISEGQYRKIAGGDGADLILESVAQEIDHEVILEQLVDPNVEPDLAAVEAVKNDPNATLPDNYLPDGRVLMENWIELERQIVEVLSKTETVALRDGKLSDDYEERIVPMKFGTRDTEIKVVSDEERDYIFILPDQSLTKVLPGTKHWICFMDRNLWLVDLDQNEAKPILSETWDGLTYEQLMERRSEMQGWNSMNMCGLPEINPSGTKMVYTAEKSELCNWNYSVFMYDVEENAERLHVGSVEHNYGVVSWLNEEEFLCMKSRNGALGTDFVIIDIHGKEQSVEFEVDSPHIIETRDGLISYMDPHNIWVEQYQGDGVFETVAHIPLGDGTTALRGGQEHFSPSGKLFVFSYQPSLESWDRLLQIYDTEEQKMIAELEIPEDVRKPAGIHEFWWINEEELLVTVRSGDPMEGNEIVSTWIYNVTAEE